MSYGHVWTEAKVRKEIINCMDIIMIARMPTASEINALGRGDLHNKISKTKGYSGWAKELGLDSKQSETVRGNKYEVHVADLLKAMSSHLTVDRMTTKHPYDLLINNCVKVDVKQGKAHYHFGSRAHTFGLHKKYPTCDIYICVALDENDNIEKYFIIPSQYAQVVTLNIGTESKYNKYINDWKFITHFVNQYEKALQIY